MRTGRVVVVTGAAGGLGAVLVDRFLANGDDVIATDATEGTLAALAARARDERVTTVPADIASPAETERLAEAVGRRHGRVDVLVNCAGYFPFAPFKEMTVEQWDTVIAVNLTGPFLVTRALLPLLLGRGWGRIVNIGSASVFDGTRGQAHYVAAKAGVVGLSRSLARELGAEGITVNVVTPGLTVTPAVRDSFPPALLEAQIRARAVPRDETPDDLVGAVFFLASPDADFISGQTVNVDGGKFMP